MFWMLRPAAGITSQDNRLKVDHDQSTATSVFEDTALVTMNRLTTSLQKAINYGQSLLRPILFNSKSSPEFDHNKQR